MSSKQTYPSFFLKREIMRLEKKKKKKPHRMCKARVMKLVLFIKKMESILTTALIIGDS